MNDNSTLDAMGLSDELDMIWSNTHDAILRKGYRIKCPAGAASARLGEGASAEVFYAEHVQDKTPAAIKIYKTDDPDLLDKFHRETKTLRAPDFPRQFSFVAYDSWHEPEAQPFVIMEFVRGLPIHDSCEQRQLSQAQRIELVEQVLRGLQELHDRNIQHRDISAANILIDEQGNVRYLDFGLAGEIIRATRHTTIDARGNRAYSPGEVVRNERKAVPKDDIFACGMLAIHLLTGNAPPENTERSGDQKHLTRCRWQLAERGVNGKLTGIVLRSLQAPERRYSQPSTMADALFDYRVRRPQRRKTLWLSVALCFFMLCLGTLGWWRYEQLQQDTAFRDYTQLRQQTEDLPYATDEAVASRLQQAEALREQWNRQWDDGEHEDALATLAQEMATLQQAIDISRALERCQPRLESLGIPLNDHPWVLQSPVIAKDHAELSQRYLEITAKLAAGDVKDAWEDIERLQQTLTDLIKQNAEAATAAAARSQYQTLAGSISERLQQEDDFAAVAKTAELAENAWTEGLWDQTGRLFGQASQELDAWLQDNETAEERAARTKASEERIAVLETEQDRLRGEINRIAAA